jgi:hypothetical protein
MDQYQLVADALWSGFALSIVAAVSGVLVARHGYRGAALGLLFASALGTLAFSFIAGFSVGPFTALIPVLITGYMAGMGRGRRTVAECLLAATIVYLAASWLLSPVGFVFVAWPISLYLGTAIVAFGWALLRPPAEA